MSKEPNYQSLSRRKIIFLNKMAASVAGFQHFGNSLHVVFLLQAEGKPPAQYFSFMSPLALEIWVFIILAYVVVSITFWIVARLVLIFF